MNPNSAHQQWSEWVFVAEVAASSPASMALDEVALPLARFVAATMGRAGRMKIVQAWNAARARMVWTITVQIEGESVYQPGWRAHVLQAFTLAAQRRFGEAVRVKMDVRLLAGQTRDGSPPSQWLVLPTLEDRTLIALPPPQSLGCATVPASTRMW